MHISFVNNNWDESVGALPWRKMIPLEADYASDGRSFQTSFITGNLDGNRKR
jgi:hypothetical protein